jgi:pimeloyl-ACP methyl ester carboxylesterase
MKIRKGEIKVGRFLVPYRIYGDHGETIICVSGAQQTMAAWRSVVSYFSNEYVVVVFDLPGQRKGGILSGYKPITMDEQIEIVRQIKLRSGDNKSINLAGSSWGAIIAAAFASRYPEFVDKIILGSFGIRPSKRLLETIKKGKELYGNGKTHEVGNLIIRSFGQRLPKAYKKRIYKQFNGIDEECAQAFYAHSELMESVSSIHDIVDLRSIKAKTLIINGEEDAILDLEDMNIAATQIPDCETRVVADTGHFLHLEREDILDIYRDFLSGEKGLSYLHPNGNMNGSSL